MLLPDRLGERMTTLIGDAELGDRRVPFVDLRVPHREQADEILRAISEALEAAAFVGGREVAAFESEFAEYVGTGYAVGVGSGTDALRLAYLAMGVQNGDEVITVPNTFIATTEALSQAGATIKFVDVDPRTSNMDPDLLERAIGPRSVGVVPVHLYGQPAELDPILEVAARRGLWVIEDAAQAHGSRYRGRRVGGDGVAAAFSFYPGKNLGACGEAGAVTTNDPGVADCVRMLRTHGQRDKYYHDCEGYNARLDAWQAAVLRIKLRTLDEANARRRQVAKWYAAALAGVPPVTLPSESTWVEGNYHLYVIQAEQRDELGDHLLDAGVETGLHYPVPLHLQRAYEHLGYTRGAFPVSEALSESLLSLPMFPSLGEADVAYVAEQVRRFYCA